MSGGGKRGEVGGKRPRERNQEKRTKRGRRQWSLSFNTSVLSFKACYMFWVTGLVHCNRMSSWGGVVDVTCVSCGMYGNVFPLSQQFFILFCEANRRDWRVHCAAWCSHNNSNVTMVMAVHSLSCS